MRLTLLVSVHLSPEYQWCDALVSNRPAARRSLAPSECFIVTVQEQHLYVGAAVRLLSILELKQLVGDLLPRVSLTLVRTSSGYNSNSLSWIQEEEQRDWSVGERRIPAENASYHLSGVGGGELESIQLAIRIRMRNTRVSKRHRQWSALARLENYLSKLR